MFSVLPTMGVVFGIGWLIDHPSAHSPVDFWIAFPLRAFIATIVFYTLGFRGGVLI